MYSQREEKGCTTWYRDRRSVGAQCLCLLTAMLTMKICVQVFIISGFWRSPFLITISISIASCPSITWTEPSLSPLSHSYSTSSMKQMHLRSTPLSQGLLASSTSGKLWYGIVLHLDVSLYLLLSYRFKLIFDLSVVTIGCFYFEGSDCETYKFVFDQLQEAVEITTDLPMCFKQLTPRGYLLAMNTDMEAAQVLGAVICLWRQMFQATVVSTPQTQQSWFNYSPKHVQLTCTGILIKIISVTTSDHV